LYGTVDEITDILKIARAGQHMNILEKLQIYNKDFWEKL
jgi:hypothetical protein